MTVSKFAFTEKENFKNICTGDITGIASPPIVPW